MKKLIFVVLAMVALLAPSSHAQILQGIMSMAGQGKLNQTITITGQPTTPLTVGGSNGSIGTATASSGLSPTATSSDTGIFTISGTSTVPIAAGTAYVDWNQSGDGHWFAAPQLQSNAVVVTGASWPTLLSI